MSDTLAYTWDGPDTRVITVTAANYGGIVTDTHVITITDMPISGLVASNDSPTLLGAPTTFTATVEMGTNISYTWDYVDDTVSDGAVVTHTYTAVGVYTATFTPRNSTGSVQASTVVDVTQPEKRIYLPVILQSQPYFL